MLDRTAYERRLVRACLADIELDGIEGGAGYSAYYLVHMLEQKVSEHNLMAKAPS